MKWLLVILAAAILSATCWAQGAEDIDLEEFTERLFEFQDEEIDYEDLYESLLQLYTSPLNINRATAQDLQSLYILSTAQIAEIQNHRQQFGKFLSIYELQAVPTLDLQTIRQMLPFITIIESEDSRPLITRFKEDPNKYFIFRTRRTLEEQKGFRDGAFLGDQNQVYGRFRASRSNDYSVGFTFEKDVGEAVGFDNYHGFDFYSAHAMIENLGPLRKLVVGDFQGQWGQGLVFGSGFGVGKGSETINTVRRSTTGLKPYTSALENNFFRGVGAAFAAGDIEVTTFYSTLRQDANVISDSTISDFEEFITSIQATGTHRTTQELASRNQILEQNLGSAITYQPGRYFTLGATALYSTFSKPLQRRPNNYNQFEFRGRHNFVGSLYFSANWQNFNFFGETARARSGGMGSIGGLIASLTPQVDFSFVYRNFARDFHTFYGNAFAEGSRAINEIGTYWGLKIKPSRQHELTLYYDKFRFPWLRFRAEAPSQGLEYLGRWTYRPSRSTTLFIQFRQEDKDRTFQPEGSNLNILTTGKRRNFVASIDFKLNRHLGLKSRVQGSDFRLSGTRTKGFAILQDINYSFWKIKVSGRIALFDTDDGENRQYLYEKNALYLFSILGLSDTGTRRYLLAQYNITKKVTIWIRYAQTHFQSAEAILTGEIGSGLSVIEGNTRSELTFQTRIKF